MKTVLKRSIALILSLCFAIPPLASCSAPEKEPSSGTPGETEKAAPSDPSVEEESEETEMSRRNTPDTLPDDLDFGGETFMIFYCPDTGPSLYVEGAEEQTGELVTDTVTLNNQSVEERLNVDLQFYLDQDAIWNTVEEIVSALLMAQDDTFDYYMGSEPGLVLTETKGFYLNAFEVPYLDFEQPWWDRYVMEELQFFPTRRTFLVGDFTLTTIRSLCVQFYNRTMYEMLYGNPDELYDLVLEGGWTLDRMLELASSAYQDTNGDGVTDKNDRLGFVAGSTYSSTDPFMYCAGIPFTTRDEDGRIVMNMNQERAVDLTSKVVDLYYQTGSYFDLDLAPGTFPAGNALFYDGQMSDASWFREMEDAFGFLPSPKFDEQQDRYYDLVSHGLMLGAIPVTSRRTAIAGAVLEALNAQAYRTAVPAYYEIALKMKYSRDEIAADIIDLIHDSAYTNFIFAYSFAMNNIGQITHEMCTNKNKNYMSIIARKEKGAQKMLTKLYERMEKNS